MTKNSRKRPTPYTASSKPTPQTAEMASRQKARHLMQTADPITYQRSLVKQKIEETKAELPHIYGFPWYRWAKAFHDSVNKINLLCAANQASKAVRDDELIPTLMGFRRADSLEVGDLIFSGDGEVVKIVDIPFIGEDECYEFLFDDGVTAITSREHVWWAKGPTERFRKTYSTRWARSTQLGESWDNPSYGKWRQYTTEEICEKGGYAPVGKPHQRFSIPLCAPVQYPTDDSLFDPYLLGLIIGDGACTAGAVNLTNPEPEIAAYILSRGGKRMNVAKSCPTFYLRGVREHLDELGLMGKSSHEKFIPREYLEAGVEQRQALLAGLMDTDGCATKNGSYSYTTTSPQLAADVRELVASLGGKTRFFQRPAGYRKNGEYHKCRDAYTVFVITPFCPFRLKRKAARWHKSRYKHERVIREVRKLPAQKMRCFTVSSPDGSFLMGKDYIVTHNSSSMIRKNIEWAGNPKLWPKLWATTPRMFWYFYPSSEVATIEFHKKWVPEFLPRGNCKNHDTYGWDAEFISGEIHAVHFRSGVSLYFKSYAQKLINLQTSTVHMISADEEMPPDFVDELLARLSATQGYFNSVFTATQGFELWYRAMECMGSPEEAFKTAFKQVVSLYDCVTYEDGSPGPWTIERIKEREAQCTTHNEVLKRVMGRFVKDEGRRYASFSPDRNLRQPEPIPRDWRIYGGVDIGSGGAKKYRSLGAVVFIAVNPEFTAGRVVMTWRGDHQETTATDILQKFREIKARERYILTNACYDYQSREFGIVAGRSGEPFVPAEKSHSAGEQMLNALFASGVLTIDDGAGDNYKLVTELMSVPSGAKNRNFRDDACFVAGTPVYTARGMLAIDRVVPGDEVLTRGGWRRVLSVSERNAYTQNYCRGGRWFGCTPRHRFYDGGVFRAVCDTDAATFRPHRLGLWRYAQCLRATQLSSEGSSFVGTRRALEGIYATIIGREEITEKKVLARFTKKFGALLSVLFLRTIIFIIRTVTRSTIESKILLVLIKALICLSMYESVIKTRAIKTGCAKFWQRTITRLFRGTVAPRAWSYIAKTVTSFGRRPFLGSRHATGVALPFKPAIKCPAHGVFAAQGVGQRTDAIQVSMTSHSRALFAAPCIDEINTTSQKRAHQHAQGGDVELRIRRVYNLSVEHDAEYFVSEMLVANCDALRYCALLVPWDFSKITPNHNAEAEQRDADQAEAAPVDMTPEQYKAWEIRMRRGEMEPRPKDGWGEFYDEIDEWNEAYGA